MTEPNTPLMQQYNAVKKQHPSALLLFRLGDFYELFYDDAVVASKILQITLTARNKEKGQAVPMCGVPYHAAETYIARLIRAGRRVAICEQMEEPGPGKKIVRREVIRVITPGTATAATLVEARENNFLAAVSRGTRAAAGSRARSARAAAGSLAGSASPPAQAPLGIGVATADEPLIGLAYVDLSTGEFRATEFSGAKAELRLGDELGILSPREILLAKPTGLFASATIAESNGFGALETRLDDWVFGAAHAARLLEDQFRVVVLDGFGLAGRRQGAAAAGAVVHYLRETSSIGAGKESANPTGPSLRPAGGGLEHLDRITFYEQQSAMSLDQVTVRNLELIESAGEDDASATLLRAIDETATGMGARLLRQWIVRPEIALAEIEARLDAVAALKSNTVAREELFATLGGILDLERLTSRITIGLAAPRDLLALRGSLDKNSGTAQPDRRAGESDRETRVTFRPARRTC